MTLQQRYESLITIQDDLTDKQKITRIKMLYMKVLYELAFVMKAAATNEIDSNVKKSCNKILDLMLYNCIIQNVKPDIELDPFHHWPVIEKEKGYTIATYLGGYGIKQFVVKEPITFTILIKQSLNIDLLEDDL